MARHTQGMPASSLVKWSGTSRLATKEYKRYYLVYMQQCCAQLFLIRQRTPSSLVRQRPRVYQDIAAALLTAHTVTTPPHPPPRAPMVCQVATVARSIYTHVHIKPATINHHQALHAGHCAMQTPTLRCNCVGRHQSHLSHSQTNHNSRLG